MKFRVQLVREGRTRYIAIDSPAAAFLFLRPKASRKDREHLWRIDLDSRKVMIGYELVSVGTLSASLVHPREVLKGALLANAAAIILAHNHPSGDVSPSEEDKACTKRIQQAADLLGIPLADHIIVSGKEYFSFREKGMLLG